MQQVAAKNKKIVPSKKLQLNSKPCNECLTYLHCELVCKLWSALNAKWNDIRDMLIQTNFSINHCLHVHFPIDSLEHESFFFWWNKWKRIRRRAGKKKNIDTLCGKHSLVLFNFITFCFRRRLSILHLVNECCVYAYKHTYTIRCMFQQKSLMECDFFNLRFSFYSLRILCIIKSKDFSLVFCFFFVA